MQRFSLMLKMTMINWVKVMHIMMICHSTPPRMDEIITPHEHTKRMGSLAHAFTRVSSCIELVPDMAVLCSYNAFIHEKGDVQ